MSRQYIKRVEPFEALCWTGKNHREMYDFLGGDPNEPMRSIGPNFDIDFNAVEGGLLLRSNITSNQSRKFRTPVRIDQMVVKERNHDGFKYYTYNQEIFHALFMKHKPIGYVTPFV